ncbi:hypothetical protein ABIB00_007219 [Bradyrhizobium sp. LB14.3]
MLRARSKLFADETTVPVLDPGRGRTKTGQLWAYAADDRPWGGLDPPGIAYVYAPDRKAERLFSHLAGYKGVLQVDGYTAYPKIAERGEVELTFCWVHMRRNFYELATAGPPPIASEALKHVAAFYAIEKEIRGRSPEERRLVRQQKSRPLADAFEAWLRAKLALISQKIKLAAAIRYALSRWQGLTRFIDDGRHRARQQYGRTIDPRHQAQSQERAVCRIRRWCRTLGGRRVPGRGLQAQRRRSACLSHRRPDQDRQWSSEPRHHQLLPWAYRTQFLKAVA